MAGLARDRQLEPVRARRSICASSTRCATSSCKAREKFKAKAATGVDPQRQHRRGRRDGLAAGLRPERSGRCAQARPPQPHDRRRLRAGLDLQELHLRHGARFRQGDDATRSTRASRSTTAASPSTISTPCTACSRVPEVFTYSSNIGAATHGARLRRRGAQGLPEARSASSTGCRPNCRRAPSRSCPKHWSDLNTMTIAFGHGLSVTPLQALMAVAALVNGGLLIPPTFLPRTRERGADARQAGASSRRPAPRCATCCGSMPRRAPRPRPTFPGYYVGGKTGTAEKVVNGRYAKHKLLDRLHGGLAGRQAEISGADHARRAAGDAGDARLRHRRLECGADRRPR